MSIRLSKALKDLNVGMSTAVDFLGKKGEKIDASPNYKLTDDQYMLLLKEFNKDMALKIESEQISQQRQTKEKGGTVSIEGYEKPQPEEKEEEVIRVNISEEQKPHFKSVGHIDLDAAAKPKQEEKKEEPIAPQEVQEPKQEEEIVETKEKEIIPVQAEKEEVPEVETKHEPEPEEENFPDNNDNKEDDFEEDVEDTVENDEKPEAEEVKKLPESEEESEEIFAVKRPILNKTPVVVGTIDLDTLNQSTRPKPKTKEQKRKEREEKFRTNSENKKVVTPAATGAAEDATPKKKRERFIKQKVDVSKVGTQEPPKKLKTQGSQQQNKRPIRNVVNEEDVQKQIKETLARLSGGNKKGKGAKYRREKRDTVHARMQEQAERDEQDKNVLKLTEFVTASELAVMMDVSINQIIATCMSIGIMVSINQRLDAETINIVAEEFGYETEFVSHDVIEAIGDDEPDSEEDLQPRAPIVTVMGHVDHGKTSLLDYIRKTNVIAGEAGGITQHIGAYNVKLDNGQRITFLDTPGHEAFTAMRARGAKVTDIAIIIVAADDNVMPQTIEAINHASAANVPIIFAINKVDKPSANPEKIKEELAQMNYLVEDWGGKYQSQDISAKQGLGVDELLEKVLLEAEMLDLKANPNKRASGSVIESSLDKGRGYISTILVENGTLHQGDIVLAGTFHGKVKAMFNERNQRIKSAKPAEPVLILGLNGAPQAGDNFNVMSTEQEAREITNKREQLQREQNLRTKKHFTLDELGRRIALGDFKELNIIVKGDVDGSVEALSDSLLKLSTENIQVNVIHKAVGAISDSDVLLAAASNAIICGFQVRPTGSARKMAEKEEIDIRLYSIIYDAIEEIKSAMEGMLSPEIKEEVTATIEVLDVFKITKVGTVAGCLVREGKVNRNNKVRLIRDGIVVYTGEIDSLKRHKDDVKEVGTNFECGISIKNYQDIKVGDIIESFEETEVKKTL
ncbi:translation initiation factor IF-2 [Paludibacter sp. 221]|uniref:translation initiation factor IF-2 n=1 Tax=Paludibacter sp. 221 TaxID=2302939 RepID=UPI0013D158B5|nr:translation initiation factor IF-2 [Paludibacter sp. 221]NDV46009.1 translation initiation factor IF-2 [Paludibacter sp. 221]